MSRPRRRLTGRWRGPVPCGQQVEGDPGIVAHVLQPLAALVHAHQHRPLSHKYQVAVATGWPSGRRVVMTAGFGLRSMATAASGSGGFDMRPPQ